MGTEIWRTAIYDDVVYEGLYQVSNLGNILSLNYRNTGKPKLMNPVEDKKGYFRVGLWKNGEYKMCLVHRLVAFVFLPNPENLPEVNHKIEGDEGKTMNFVFFNEDGTVDEEKSTIEWCDRNYNHNYGTINQRISKARINRICSKKVLQFSLTGDLIREWPSTMECKRNGFNQGAVAACCRGERKTYKGFRWEYK